MFTRRWHGFVLFILLESSQSNQFLAKGFSFDLLPHYADRGRIKSIRILRITYSENQSQTNSTALSITPSTLGYFDYLSFQALLVSASTRSANEPVHRHWPDHQLPRVGARHWQEAGHHLVLPGQGQGSMALWRSLLLLQQLPDSTFLEKPDPEFPAPGETFYKGPYRKLIIESLVNLVPMVLGETK